MSSYDTALDKSTLDWEGIDDVYEDGRTMDQAHGAHSHRLPPRYMDDFTPAAIMESKLGAGTPLTEFEDTSVSSPITLKQHSESKMAGQGGTMTPQDIVRSLDEQLATAQADYQSVPREKPGAAASVAKSEEGRARNRYGDIFAYDDTRVKLLSSSTSDYINANHVSLQAGERNFWYVATQGPTKATTPDFWRMVWEQGSEMVVMVTSEVEAGRVKCERYWPSEEGEYDAVQHGDFRVTLLGQVSNEAYVLRGLRVKNTITGEKRSIRQLQYTAWPDKNVPENTALFMRFLDEVASTRNRLFNGNVTQPLWPTIVHCSAGVGRTGVVIMVEVALALIDEGVAPNLKSILQEMRDQRMLLVQTYAQYKFCHEVLKAALTHNDSQL